MTNSPTSEMIGNNLVLFADTRLKNDLTIRGNIYCKNGYHSLTVDGSIEAENIDIKNIDAGDIYADEIFCDKRLKKTPEAKTIARLFVQNRSNLERKEQMLMEAKA